MASFDISRLHSLLSPLSYRGYDSYGFGTITGGTFWTRKGVGPLPDEVLLPGGSLGLAHVRWSSHGGVSELNAHPIASDSCLVVHNGIVRNWRALRNRLELKGYVFLTDTDTEVIAHLLSDLLTVDERPLVVLQLLMGQLEGDLCFAAISKKWPNRLLLASRGISLYLSDRAEVSSDPISFGCGKAWILKDGICTVGGGKHPRFMSRGLDGKHVTLKSIDCPPPAPKKTGGKMLAEILEQPALLLRGPRGDLHGLVEPDRIWAFGCGSSLNAALLGKRYLEHFAGIPTEVYHSCDAQFTLPKTNTLCVAVTQSGETRDTLSALYSLADYDRLVITNRSYSEAAREAEHTICLDCGEEEGVAATKTFTQTLLAFLRLARQFMLSSPSAMVAEGVRQVLERRSELFRLAQIFSGYEHILLLARDWNYAIALEGALKLKEVSYIHAEALHAGEMKHGPIALIDDKTLSVFLVTDDTPQIRGNIDEIMARGGRVVVIGRPHPGAMNFELRSDLPPYLEVFPLVVALQLISHEIALLKGINPDRPRALCKANTVE